MTQVAVPELEVSLITAMFDAGKHDAVAERILGFLDFFQSNTAYYLDQELYGVFKSFHDVFIRIFPDERFEINAKYAEQFICHGRLISNLLAITCNSTQALLEVLECRSRNFVKILTLLSPRNVGTFNLSDFFEWNPRLASFWYCTYAGGYFGTLSEERSFNNLVKHYEFRHRYLNIIFNADVLYFGCTFVDQGYDRDFKKLINEQIRKKYSNVIIKNTPCRKKIGFFSLCWQLNHSVYRNYFAYVAELSRHFEITFFDFKNSGNDTQCFHEVITVNNLGELLGHSRFINNNFQAFYMPDVGMNTESIILANLRIAPIQFCSPGHSVSTYGSNMDYFISGLDVEPAENAQSNYSEKLVLIPGMGVVHNVPRYQKKSPAKTKSGEEFIINCSWHAQKVTHRLLVALSQILNGSTKKIRFRFFLGQSLSGENDYLPFLISIAKALGYENIQLFPGLSYDQYMMLMEEGSLSLDSFHFGGCNTVSDSLFLGIPIVALEGGHWYNRIGPQMLRLVGMDDFIASSVEDFVRIALSLINDSAYLDHARTRLTNADLSNTIYSTEYAKCFPLAIQRLIDSPAI